MPSLPRVFHQAQGAAAHSAGAESSQESCKCQPDAGPGPPVLRRGHTVVHHCDPRVSHPREPCDLAVTPVHTQAPVCRCEQMFTSQPNGEHPESSQGPRVPKVAPAKWDQRQTVEIQSQTLGLPGTQLRLQDAAVRVVGRVIMVGAESPPRDGNVRGEPPEAAMWLSGHTLGLMAQGGQP